MSVVLSNPKATLAGGAIAISEIDGTPLDLSIDKIKFSNDSVTVHGDGSATVITGIGGGDVSSDAVSSIIGEVALFADTGGKVIKRSTLTGLLKSNAGVLQMATPNADYAPSSSPIFTGSVRSTLANNENILIDARTNPRDITLGVMRVEHTAGISGTRPITLDVDANGFGNTRAIVTDFKATGLTTTSETHLHEVNIDTANSTGGKIQAFTVSKSGSGAVGVTALEIYPGVDILVQKTGSPVALSQAWTLLGTTYGDVTAAFGDGTNAPIFSADNEYIVCGADTPFSQLEVYLATLSSHTINAVFEYSTGAGAWQTFSPADATNGFTTNGTIAWGSLAGWVAASVNSVLKYYIRIQRTRNLITTTPVEQNIRVISSTDFGWDKNGDLTIRKVKLIGLLVYADRTAAQAGGLVTGEAYQTSDGTIKIV